MHHPVLSDLRKLPNTLVAVFFLRMRQPVFFCSAEKRNRKYAAKV